MAESKHDPVTLCSCLHVVLRTIPIQQERTRDRLAVAEKYPQMPHQLRSSPSFPFSASVIANGREARLRNRLHAPGQAESQKQAKTGQNRPRRILIDCINCTNCTAPQKGHLPRRDTCFSRALFWPRVVATLSGGASYTCQTVCLNWQERSRDKSQRKVRSWQERADLRYTVVGTIEAGGSRVH